MRVILGSLAAGGRSDFDRDSVAPDRQCTAWQPDPALLSARRHERRRYVGLFVLLDVAVPRDPARRGGSCQPNPWYIGPVRR